MCICLANITGPHGVRGRCPGGSCARRAPVERVGLGGPRAAGPVAVGVRALGTPRPMGSSSRFESEPELLFYTCIYLMSCLLRTGLPDTALQFAWEAQARGPDRDPGARVVLLGSPDSPERGPRARLGPFAD